MEINIPEVRAEVEPAFRNYEAALMGNDVAVLNELFWESDETIRYGPQEALYGFEEISGFRSARDVSDIARTLTLQPRPPQTHPLPPRVLDPSST